MKTKFNRKLAVIIAVICAVAAFAGLSVNAAEPTRLLIGQHITYMYSTDDVVLVSDNPKIAEVRDLSVYGMSEGITQVHAMVNNTVYKTYTFSVSTNLTQAFYGDINSDNDVTVEDVKILQQYFTKKSPVIMNFQAADMDNNGVVNIFDLIWLKRLIEYGTYPPEETDPTEPNTEATTETTQTPVVTTTVVTTTQSQEQVARQYAEQVVSLVNEERAKEGAAPLTFNETLFDAAMVRTDETLETFSHTRPNGESWKTILTEYNLNYSMAAENIAAGSSSPEGVVEQWMNSAGHRNNIMNPELTEIGVGYCYDPNSYYKYYWVQLFIKPQ